MGTHQDTSTLTTLADAVTETAAAEYGTEGSANVTPEGLDVNAAFDGGGVVVVTDKVAQTETRVVGVGGPDSGSGESKGNKVSGFEGEGDKICGCPNGEESGRENMSGLDKEFGEVNGSLSSKAQMGNKGGNKEKEDLNGDGRSNTIEIDGKKEDCDDVEYMEDHRYSVGDLVWGKIKGHPWWPGQIYDPSYASKSAMKYNQNGPLLVAYFGDGSFAWCSQSQLIPFAQHFEDMSKQSSSKTFVNAVQEAVDEIGRLVELEMTCPCVPEGNRKGLARPLAVNAGIKAGVLVPNGQIGKLLSFRYDPVELLATVGNAAETVSFASLLELAILKSWLSAFYRAREGYALPVYYEPLQIEGLEDKDRNETLDNNDFSVPIEVPIHRPLEEELFSYAAPGPANGQASQEGKNHHRRKQKSVAEIMAERSGAKPKINKRISLGKGANASNSAIKKQKLSDEVENRTSGVDCIRRKRVWKKDEISQSGEPTASDRLNGCQTEAEMQERSVSSKLGRDRITVPESNDGEGMKGSEEMSSPREKKKSKYLSPPYTTPEFRAGNLSSKKEGEPKKITNSTRMGERMTKAAGKLLDSPSTVVCNGKTVEKKLPQGETGSGGNTNSQTGNQGQKKIMDTMSINASAKEVLSGVQSFAINPLYSWNTRLLDWIGGFILTFRSTVYQNKHHGRKKRKTLSSKPEKLLVSDLNQTGEKSVVAQTGVKKSMQEKSCADTQPKAKKKTSSIKEKPNAPRTKKAARGSAKKEDNKEVKITSTSGVGEITDLGSIREKLQMMASMLERCDGKISGEAKSKIDGDIELLFEKVKKMIAETAASN